MTSFRKKKMCIYWIKIAVKLLIINFCLLSSFILVFFYNLQVVKLNTRESSHLIVKNIIIYSEKANILLQ